MVIKIFKKQYKQITLKKQQQANKSKSNTDARILGCSRSGKFHHCQSRKYLGKVPNIISAEYATLSIL